MKDDSIINPDYYAAFASKAQERFALGQKYARKENASIPNVTVPQELTWIENDPHFRAGYEAFYEELATQEVGP